jgi:hypothetical protein
MSELACHYFFLSAGDFFINFLFPVHVVAESYFFAHDGLFDGVRSRQIFKCRP